MGQFFHSVMEKFNFIIKDRKITLKVKYVGNKDVKQLKIDS